MSILRFCVNNSYPEDKMLPFCNYKVFVLEVFVWLLKLS